MGVDALTVAPYMGSDSVRPFLGYDGKWVVLLALTSNPGSHDFQMLPTGESMRLFENVLATARGWGAADELMFVVGGTQVVLLLITSSSCRASAPRVAAWRRYAAME